MRPPRRQPWLENCLNRVGCDVASPKASASGRRVEPTTVLRARNPAPYARCGSYKLLHCNLRLRGNDGLNVFGCGRLIAGIGFVRLPASSTSGVTGGLTCRPTFPLRCDTLPEVFPP